MARYYMEKRSIPETNLVKVKCTTEERCSRDEYNKGILKPVQNAIIGNVKIIRCIVTMYRVPLVVLPEKPSKAENAKIENYQQRLNALRGKIQQIKKSEASKNQRISLQKEIDEFRAKIRDLQKVSQIAAVDSELSLALFDRYRLDGWQPNPYFVGYRAENIVGLRHKVVLVSRLDAPNAKIVRRIIDDSIEVEKTGLAGTAYFDARRTKPVGSRNPNYKTKDYDTSIRDTAELVKKSGLLNVVLDTSPELFQPGDCPDAALYCGWYSLANYVDAFTWKHGSIGYHIASQECQTLRGNGRRFWCKYMLQDGVAATIGPVDEPYLQAFPVPEVFFGLLIGGKHTLVECFFLSKPFLSWRMVLIGDPLYSPFKVRIRK